MADRLDEIRGRLDRHEQYVRRVGGLWRHTLTTDLHWLVAEVDRLRAELNQSRTYRITEGVDRG